MPWFQCASLICCEKWMDIYMHENAHIQNGIWNIWSEEIYILQFLFNSLVSEAITLSFAEMLQMQISAHTKPIPPLKKQNTPPQNKNTHTTTTAFWFNISSNICCWIPQLISQGSPNVGWDSSMCNHFPTSVHTVIDASAALPITPAAALWLKEF